MTEDTPRPPEATYGGTDPRQRAAGAADSSPRSAPASPTSEPDGFIADAGPEFDPEAPGPRVPPPPVAERDGPAPAIEWEEDTVGALLRLKGRALHGGVGVAEEDWLYTELDIAAISPPLTRILNRYEPTQRLARHSDPLLLALALGGYGARSVEERAAALRALEPADVESIEPLEEEGPAINRDAPPPPVPRAPVDVAEVDWQVGGR